MVNRTEPLLSPGRDLSASALGTYIRWGRGRSAASRKYVPVARSVAFYSVEPCDPGADPRLDIGAGGRDEDSVRAAFEAGATDYLTRPFTPSQLRARLQACLLRFS